MDKPEKLFTVSALFPRMVETKIRYTPALTYNGV